MDTLAWLQFSADQTTITGFNYVAGVSPSEITIPKYGPDGVTLITAIGNSAFSGCALTTVQFETGSAITSLGSTAFQNNLFTAISLPGTVQTIGNSAFQGCSQLASIDLSNLSLARINNGVLRDCALTSLTLPDGLLSIGDDAFRGCGRLSYIKIPASVTTITGSFTFNGMASNSVIDLTDHEPGSIANGAWGASDSIVRWASSGNANSSIFVFNQATGKICGIKESVGNAQATGSMNITIPATIDGVTVTGLADGAFGSRPANQKLKTVTFASGVSMTSIPMETFRDCNYLTSVTNIPEGVTMVGTEAFYFSRALTSITLPASLITVQASAFRGTNALRSVTFLGDQVTFIHSGAFSNTGTVLTDIYLTEMDQGSVAGAPWSAGYATVHWKDADVPPEIVTDDTGLWRFNTVTHAISAYLGSTGTNVNLVVPATLAYRGTDYAITTVGVNGQGVISQSPKTLKSLTISDGITVIEASSFLGVSIGTLDLGNTVQRISINAFQSCGLKTLTLPDSLLILRGEAFRSNNLSGEITIPGNVTSIEQAAFSDNPNIKRFTIKQYRIHASDPGAYDDAAGLYKKAPRRCPGQRPVRRHSGSQSGLLHGRPPSDMDAHRRGGYRQ